MELWNFRGKQNSITEAFDFRVPEHAVISVTGAGGKTSLVTAWARELASSGRRAVITTTTHMIRPSAGRDDTYQGIKWIDSGQIDDIRAVCRQIDDALGSEGIALVASPDPAKPGKVMSPPPEVMEFLYRNADAVLIEADGSRRLPFKWPAPHEPAVPDRTDLTVCAAGLSALGRRIDEAVYRYEDIPDAMIRSPQVDENLLFAVLSSQSGGQKGVRGDYRVFLNQADTEELRAAASRLQMMFAVCGIQSAWGMLLSVHS